MIRVHRGAAPEGFTSRSTDWEKGFQHACQQNPKLTASKYWSNVRRKIRADAQALYVAFYGKCAFCESKMAHTSSPHIEHYRPKSKYPDLMFAWQNWLLSCGRCNECASPTLGVQKMGAFPLLWQRTLPRRANNRRARRTH